MRLPDWPGPDSVLDAEGLPRDGSGSSEFCVHPDRHSPDWYRELSSRLGRLPEAHPSAWPVSRHADWVDGRDRDGEIWWRGNPEDLDERAGEEDDGLGPDELGEAGLGEAGLGEDGFGEDGQFGLSEPGALGACPDSDPDESDSPAPEPGSARGISAPGGRRTAPAGWGELGTPPTDHSLYRPWFSASGTADPWFAADWGE